jgi:ketosteroid isomerase-like protein
MSIKTDDRSAIVDLLARYCWLVDEGDGDGWAALWTKDGKFTGMQPPLEGTEQLRQLPPGFFGMGDGKLRHVITNIVVDAGKTADEASAKGYSSVYDVRAGAGKLMIFARVTYTMVRLAGQWKIKALHADMLFNLA